MADDVRELIEKYALQNAVKYKATPQVGAVMGKLMGENPELRSRAKEMAPIVAAVLKEVAKTSPEEWQKRLEEIAPQLLEELNDKKEPIRGLPPLKETEGGVVMRFAPNPNGPPTLGSSRGIIVNSEYVKRYGGKFILRFDDTDPVNKRPMPEAYDWYLEDCQWLDANPDKVVVASERLPKYYQIAEELINRNAAYVCRCDQATFKKYKDAAQACPHRDQTPETNLDLWEKMLNGDFEPGDAVLRIKTDISQKDPALRDWAAFRIVTTDHPLVGDRYRIWPLLDFESGIEDHLQGVSHIIRGKDLMDSGKRQWYLYEHMNWEYPTTIHWGRIKIHQFGSFSTSALRRDLEAGLYSGWDDPKMPTVKAIRRRGIQAQALRTFMIDLGVGETDISISMETVYAENRKLVDPHAKRRFFVKEPVSLQIDGNLPQIAKAPLHPNHDKGIRHIPVEPEILVSKEDVSEMEVGNKIRLKDLCNLEILNLNPLKAITLGEDPKQAKEMKMRIIHWAPRNGVPVKVMRPDGVDEGIGELEIRDDLDLVDQFERYGFVRIDSVGDDVVAYFAHR